LNSNTLWGTTYLGGAGGNGMASVCSVAGHHAATGQFDRDNGNPAACTVAATGAGQLNYQWYYQSNAAIVGATNNILYFTMPSPIWSAVISRSSPTYTAAPPAPCQPRRRDRAKSVCLHLQPSRRQLLLSMANVAKSTNRLWASTNLAAPIPGASSPQM